MATQAAQAHVLVKKPGFFSRLDAGSGVLPYFLILPTIIIILLVAVYPIVDSIALSFLDNPLIATGSTFVGLRNYLQILADPQFQSSIGVTLVFSVVSVAIETILGLGVALLINRAVSWTRFGTGCNSRPLGISNHRFRSDLAAHV